MSYFKNMAFYIGYGYDRAKNAEAVEKFLQLQGYRSDKDETTNKKYRDQHAFIYGYNYIIADCNGLYYFSSKNYNYPSHSIPNQKPKAMKYTGRLVEGDFERNTMTLRVDGELILQAGKYKIEQIEVGNAEHSTSVEKSWFESIPLHWRYIYHTIGGVIVGYLLHYIF